MKKINLFNIINSDEFTIKNTILSMFSHPKTKTNNYPSSYHLISINHYDAVDEQYDFKGACYDLNGYGFKKIVLFSITKNPKYYNKLWREEIYENNKETIIIEYTIPSFMFWTDSSIKQILFFKDKKYKQINNVLFDDLNNADFIINKFDNCTWEEIISQFKLLNISISGGSDTKKQILSPLISDFHTFLLCLHKASLRGKVITSFHNINKFSNRNWFDYNLSLEELKSHLLELKIIYETSIQKIIADRDDNIDPSRIKILNIDKLEEIINITKKIIEKKELENKKLENTKNKDNIKTVDNTTTNSSVNKKEIETKDLNDSKNNNNPFKSGQKRNYHIIYTNLTPFNYNQNYSTLVNKDKNKKFYSTNLSKIDIIIKIENLFKNEKFKEIYSRIEYKSIDNLIHNRVDLTDSEKQFEIENFYINTIRKRIDDMIKTPKIFNTNEGFKLLNKAIKDLDDKLNELKTPKFLNSKKYAWVFANLSNSLLISVTFSILIPLIYAKNPLEQKYQNIIYKIGKSLYKAYLSEHYSNYLNLLNKLIKKNKDNKTKKAEYILFDILTKKEIIVEINDIYNKIDYQDFANKICFTKIVEDNFYEIGHDIIQYLDLTTEYIKIENYYKEDKIFTKILPGKSIDELFDISFMEVSMLPMICKPNDWKVKKKYKKIKNIIKFNENIKIDETSENNNYEFEYIIKEYGGYLSNNYEHNHFIHKTPINASIIKIINEDIINTINYIQSVPFQINLNVLHHILNLIVENYNFDDPVFFNTHNEYKKIDEYKKNKEFSKVNEILRQNSIANANIATLSAGFLLRKTTFYNPIYTDWRGRIYASNSLLSFQGSELNRSLLYFNKGNILNEKSLESLKIYTANCFGLSKMSYNYRINWVNDHIQSILNFDQNLWLDAKEKYLFIACSYELLGYYNDPNNFISRLPIYLDATASGLQHLSVMTKDINLARYVNILKSTNNENPYDIYKIMAKKVSDVTNDISDFSTYSLLKKLDIIDNREFTKTPIMTTSYGVTLRGIKDQLIDNIFIKTDEKHRYILEKNNFEKVTNVYKLKDIKFLKEDFKEDFELFRLKGTEIIYLAKIIHNTLYDTYPSLKLFVKYLNDINELLNEISLEIGIVWNTPSGLNLEQKYLETIPEIKTKNILGRRKSYTIQKTIPKINKMKQKRGTMPNLIHSMDAGNISLLVNIFIKNNNNINLVTVHDCFLTDANNIDMIHFHVRLAFLRIYQDENFIEDFHNNLINYLKNLGIKFNSNNTKIYLNDNNMLIIPKKPNFKNNLDLSYNLFNSPYFIN
jgi:hypothetical protein